MLFHRLTACALFVFTLFAASTPRVSAQQPSQPSQNAGASGAGSIFVSNSGDGTISVIPAVSNHVTATIPLGPNAHVEYVGNNMYISHDGTKLNVVTHGNSSVRRNTTVISTATDSIIGTINGTYVYLIGPPVALSPDGSVGYFAVNSGPGKIYKVLMPRFSTTKDNSAILTFAGSPPVFSHISSFAISPDGAKFYITDTFSRCKGDNRNVVWVIPTVDTPHGFMEAPGKVVPVISDFFGTANAGIMIPQKDDVIPVGHNPQGVAVSPDGKTIYVSNQDDDTVSVVSAGSNAAIDTIPVGSSPRGVAVSPDGSMVYVVNHGDDDKLRGTVSVISAATNKVIANIRVGRGPVGIAVSGKPSAPAQDIYIRTDTNKDGIITFDKTTDRATSANPYTFWLNDNRDVLANGEWEDADPAKILPDKVLPYIMSPRDFEDFERLQIRLPPGFSATDGKWEIKLQFTDVGVSEPVINVVPAKDASMSYLTDSYDKSAEAFEVKKSHFSEDKIRSITKVKETALPLSELSITNDVVPLLFEGVVKGKGALTVRLYKSGTEVGKDHVYLNLLPITQMYDHYTADPLEHGLPWQDGGSSGDSGDSSKVTLTEIETTPRLLLPGDETKHDNNDYILFVHGWRMQRWERIAFGQTAFKRLWHLGYKGRFGLFSWPTEYTPIVNYIPLVDKSQAPKDLDNYDNSEQKAYVSAQALHRLLVQLNSKGYTVRVFAHSMGNIVTSEALRLEVKTGRPQKLVQTYVASQSAVPAQSYDAKAPSSGYSSFTPNVYAFYPTESTNMPYYGTIDEAAGKLINFFNSSDYALSAWGINQGFKPDGGYSYHRHQPDRNLGKGNLGDYWPGIEGFYHNNLLLPFPEDTYEIFAKAAPAHSKATGDQGYVPAPYQSALGKETLDYIGLGKPFTTQDQVNLGSSPYNFGGKDIAHSAQFQDTFGKREAYWEQLLKAFGLGKGTPN